MQNVKDRKICKNLHNFFIKSINRYDKKIENLIFQDNISQIIINVSRDDIAFGGRNKEYRWAIENISASQIWQKYLDEYEDEFPEISNLSTPDTIEEILVLEDEQDENSNYICPNLDGILNSYIIFNGKANNFNVMALPKSKITLRQEDIIEDRLFCLVLDYIYHIRNKLVHYGYDYEERNNYNNYAKLCFDILDKMLNSFE